MELDRASAAGARTRVPAAMHHEGAKQRAGCGATCTYCLCASATPRIALSLAEFVLAYAVLGLGFTVFTKVLDRKTLNILMISVGSFFGTALPLIIALMPDSEQKLGEAACDLDEHQVASIRVAMMTRNRSCSYANVTLDEIIRIGG